MRIQSLSYAGHSAVFIKTDSSTIAIDPWINGNPSLPSDFKIPSDLSLIALSHGHADHACDSPSLCKEYGAKVAATYELAMIMIKEGVPQQNVIPLNRGGSAKVDGID
ncbi:MAG: MBL fold metallo-hydrolase, partial [SAR324 cluster bacterium]|nr:MBL fold metallo-hydrolase [SAR324 cluster bacterium]